MARGARRRLGAGLIVAGAVAIAGAAVGLASGGTDQPDAAPATTAARATTTTAKPVTAEDAAAFVRDLMRAVNESDVDFLVAHLDTVVVGVYGAAACESHIRSSRSRSVVTVTGVDGPAAYDWKVDGLSFTVRDVWNVRVDDTSTGRTVRGTVHVGTAGARPSWFVDCGTPLPQEQRKLPVYEVEA